LALATLVANANPQLSAGNQPANITTAVLNAAALIAWDQIILATLLGALKYPLPDDFDLVRAGAVKQTGAAPTVTESTMLNQAAKLMEVHLAANADAPSVKAQATQPGIETAPRVSESTNTVRAELFPEFAEAVLRFPAVAFAHELSLSLDFSHNEVSTILNKLVWSTALLIIDADQTTNSQVTISSNRIRSQSSSATAGVFFVNRCTVTGNLMVNEQPQKGSLFLIAPLQPNQKLPDASTAITGNVFGGPPVLAAARPVFTPAAPPPMNTWDFFNTRF